MDWPETPVEYRSAFQPTFCPRPSCSEHRRTRPGYRCSKDGGYSTKRRKRVQRFICSTCGEGFSTQTFSATYYCKRPELLRPVAAGLVAGSALRQIARSEECSPNTVARMAARLGRHAMLLHALCLEQLQAKVSEPLVFDHLETFEFTQDYPVGIGTAVGSESWFVYGLDPAPHGRGGRRSEVQEKRLRSRPKRALRGRYAGSTRRVLDSLLKLRPAGQSLGLIGDGHLDYERAVRAHPLRAQIRLLRFPNSPRGPKGSPRSPEAQVRDEELFPVDLLHKILRHTLAELHRETIAFARRLNASMERMFLTAVWRNLVKKRTERATDETTPATLLGLTDRRWNWRRVLSRRLFYNRTRLPEPWPELYRRDWTTPLLPSNARHRLLRAF